MTKSTSHRVTDFDKHIGRRLRTARQLSGTSQDAAGKLLGVSFQQIHKIETGQNRASAGRLFQLSHLYRRPLSWFFEGLPTNGATHTTEIDPAGEMCGSVNGLRLARHYLALRTPGRRMVEALAEGMVAHGDMRS